MNTAFSHYAQLQAYCQCLFKLLLSIAASGLGVNLLSLINEFLVFRLCPLFQRLNFPQNGDLCYFCSLISVKECFILFYFKKENNIVKESRF